jgi:hypothetical protein
LHLPVSEERRPGGECYRGTEVRFSQKILSPESAAIAVAALLPLLFPILCSAQQLTPAEALDRYLARAGGPQPVSSDSVYTVQIDASIPTLHKQGSMTGLKVISYTGQVVYRGLRFTGDKLVKTAVIARFLSNDTEPAVRTADVAVSRQNYWFTYNKTSNYNGLTAYVFLLKPRRKRAGLFRGELWLTADTAAPLRLWGDLVKSPSIFIRSFRFVEDYQTVAKCTQPLRLVLTIRTRIAGTVEMVVWQHSAADSPESIGAGEGNSQFPQGGQTSK